MVMSSPLCWRFANHVPKYAEAQGWRFEVMEASMNSVGGFKEVVAMVSGQSVTLNLSTNQVPTVCNVSL